MTMKDFTKLTDDLERVNFRKRRMEFVTQTLQEFDNMDPSALDIIFEYQSEDLKEQMADLKELMKNPVQMARGRVYINIVDN